MADDAAKRLFDLAASLATETSLDRVLDRVLAACLAVTGAERGFIVLLEDGDPVVRRAHPREPAGRVSWTVLGRVLAEDRPLVLADVRADPEVASARSVQRQHVRAVCALPLRTPGEAVGAIYLDHRTARAFPPELLDKLHAFAGLAAFAIINLRPRDAPPRDAPSGHPKIVAVDPVMRRVLALVGRFAVLPYPVYLHGESGTGKELVARAIHEASQRRDGPFVAANCSAIAGGVVESELFGHVRGAFTGADRDRVGLFEQAAGGTLLLDEVEAMPPALQEKLLRVLQDGEVRRVGASAPRRVDVRIVSASNEDLEFLDARFRRDLFYRLNVLRIDLPPLRERQGDLGVLVEHLLARIARETGTEVRDVSAGAIERLSRHVWPGNVRELENALRRACALSASDALQPEDFAFLTSRAPVPEDALIGVDDYIRRAVERYGARLGLSELAARLGVSRKTLWKKRKKWGVP